MGINRIETKLDVGAAVPFKAVHITDTHLTHADMRDGERKTALAHSRAPYFPLADEVLRSAAATAKAENAPILHTGDLIDFVSAANLEAARRFTGANDCFVAAGNHEFSLYVGEAKEDAAYRNQSLAAVQQAFGNDIRMSARTLNGVNFVALDDGYYLFERAQFLFLKKEVEKGMPVVLLMHTPIYTPSLYDIQKAAGEVAYLTAVPEARMRDYPADRYEQQIANETTRETVAYIMNQPTIRAIIAGHIHKNTSSLLAGRIPQITTACTDIRLIEFV